MSENILSLEDLKYLQELHQKFGVDFIRYDDEGLHTNTPVQTPERMASLEEISKKLKYRLNSNFELNFTDGLQFDVVRV